VHANVNVETILLFACMSAACNLFAKFGFHLPPFQRGVGIAGNARIIEELIETAANWCYMILRRNEKTFENPLSRG
jgi:hypothetical protein